MGAPYALSSDLVSAWPAKSLEVAQYIDGQLPLIAMTQNAQTGTTYSLAATDFTKLVTLSNASPVTVTVPLESSVAWAAGTQLRLMNLGAGVVTVVGAGGVTINGSPLTLAQYKDGTLVKTGTNTWTFNASSAGAVLQVKSTAKTDTFTTSSASLVDVTSLSVAITPSSASNKILVTVHLNAANNFNATAFTAVILRDSTLIAIGDAAGSRIRRTFVRGAAPGDLYIAGTFSMTFLDSPATTSALTYKIQVSSVDAAAMYINRSVTDSDTANNARGISTITVMEVTA